MGIGRNQREEQLEERHNRYVEEVEHSELPDWIHEMYEQPRYESYKKGCKKLKWIRFSAKVLLLGALASIVIALFLMVKGC